MRDLPRSESSRRAFVTRLSLPYHEDTVQTLHTKLESYLLTIRSGVPLGNAFDALRVDDQESHLAEDTAEMHDWEREALQAWTRGFIRMPEVKWLDIPVSTPKLRKGYKSPSRRAEALNRLYDKQNTEPYQASWFVQAHDEFLPLLNAVSKVIGEERATAVMTRQNTRQLQLLRLIIKRAMPIAQRAAKSTVREQVLQQLSLLVEYRKRIVHNNTSGSIFVRSISVTGSQVTM